MKNSLFDEDMLRPYVRPQRAPYVSNALIIINIFIFIIMCIMSCGKACFSPDSQLLVDWGANWAPLTLNGQAWRLLTACFIHIGFLHVLMNMAVLWQVGI